MKVAVGSSISGEFAVKLEIHCIKKIWRISHNEGPFRIAASLFFQIIEFDRT